MSTPSELRPTSALTDEQIQALASLEGAIVEYPRAHWFQFDIIRGSGHTSIWIGPVLVTLDWYGYKHRGLPLISINWMPD